MTDYLLNTVTLIIPCRNEELYIEEVIQNMLSQDYPKELIKLFIVDGCSTDKTADIISSYSMKYDFIKHINNTNKTVPYALNTGITKANSNYIIILGAHCKYNKSYISDLINTIKTYDADNVGGVLNTLPGNNSITAKAISIAASCKFGVGNSYFRIGDDKIREVDTVPFGCFKIDVFKKIGLFDTDLTRNQDDELNARMLKNNLKILLNPKIKIDYFMRTTIVQVAKMFYQYGYYKPLVCKKIGNITTARQLAPALFVAYLFGTPIILYFTSYSIIFFLYLLINLLYSLKLVYTNDKKSLKLLPMLFIVFFVIHTNYGLGYIRGLIDFIFFDKKNNKSTDMTR